MTQSGDQLRGDDLGFYLPEPQEAHDQDLEDERLGRVADSAGAAAVEASFFTARRVNNNRARGTDEMVDRSTYLIERCERAANGLRREAVREAERHGRVIDLDEAFPTIERAQSDVDASYDIARTLIEGKRLGVWACVDDLFNIPRQEIRGERYSLHRLRQITMLDTKGFLGSTGYAIVETMKLFNELQLPGPNINLHVVLDDLGKPAEEVELRSFLLSHMLRQFGLTNDSSNMNVKVVKTSDYASMLESTIEDLANAGNGRLRQRSKGDTYFEFAPWLLKWFDLQYRDAVAGAAPRGAVLKDKDGYSRTLTRMLPFLDQSNDAAMHVQLGVFRGVERDIETMLRAGEYRRPDNSLAFTGAHLHTFSFNTFLDRVASRDVYGIATLLSAQAKSFRHSLRAASFDKLQAEGEDGYLTINYEKKLPQDRIIIRAQMRAEAKLALRQQIDPNDPSSLYRRGDVMHICVGTNPYAVMMSGIYSQRGEGTVLGWDIAPDVINYNSKVKQDASYDLTRRQMWQEEIIAAIEELKDEPEFRELGLTPAHFNDIDRWSRQQLDVAQNGIEDLPPNTFKRIFMHFGVEATARSRVEYHSKMRTVSESMRGDDARLIMVLTEKSDPLWPGGKNKKFVAYSSEMRGFELAMLDCGLTIEHFERIDEHLPEDQKLREGESFVLIVAKLRPEAIQYD